MHGVVEYHLSKFNYIITLLLRYAWPEEVKNEDGSLQESGTRTVGAGETIYMSDELGLHRV